MPAILGTVLEFPTHTVEELGSFPGAKDTGAKDPGAKRRIHRTGRIIMNLIFPASEYVTKAIYEK